MLKPNILVHLQFHIVNNEKSDFKISEYEYIAFCLLLVNHNMWQTQGKQGDFITCSEFIPQDEKMIILFLVSFKTNTTKAVQHVCYISSILKPYNNFV